MSKGPKVLHVIDTVKAESGGTAEALKQLVNGYHEGVIHEIVSLDSPASLLPAGFDVTVHQVGPKQKWGRCKSLDQWLNEHIQNFDLLVIHGCWQYHGRAVRLACKRSGIPYVQYPHGMLDPWFKRQYPLKHIKKIPYWLLVESKNLKQAERVIFTSQDEKDESAKSFVPYKVTPSIISLGIEPPPEDVEQQKEAFLKKHPELRNRRILLYLGRIHQKKGLDVFIDAVSKLNADKRQLPEGDAPVIVIAGPLNETSFISSLKNQIEDLPKPANGINQFIWTGMLKGDEKWGAFRCAEAFFLPSHQENFGIAVAESLACSTPVILTYRVNIWREIVESNAGLACEATSSDIGNILEKWLCLSKDERQQRRFSALKCYEAFYKASTCRKSFDALVLEILNI